MGCKLFRENFALQVVTKSSFKTQHTNFDNYGLDAKAK